MTPPRGVGGPGFFDMPPGSRLTIHMPQDHVPGLDPVLVLNGTVQELAFVVVYTGDGHAGELFRTTCDVRDDEGNVVGRKVFRFMVVEGQ